MNYKETIEYIHEIPKFRRPLGNAQLERLLDAAGNPQDKLKYIHLAGTNGKGSTAAMLSKMLQLQGYKTGLFTSPFIEVFNERIQINGQNIPDEDLAVCATMMRSLMEENEAYVSEFAFITAVAFMYFARCGCDYVVLETGMGGRLDATNIVKNTVLSVLTSISLDHMQFLGDTIEEIAQEKCGIIKRGMPVVSYPNAAVKDIIEASAKENGSELIFASDPELTENGFIYKKKVYQLGLKGAYQPKNAAVAVEAAKMLNKYGVVISEENIKKALETASWMVRYEFIRENLVIDGGHNIDGVRELRKSLENEGKKIYLVMAMMEDKSFDECIAEISRCAARVYCTQIDMPRCAKASEIAAVVKSAEVRIIENPIDAVKLALSEAGENTLVCVCGSLYLAGEIRREFAVK